jgi:hypothetical protein
MRRSTVRPSGVLLRRGEVDTVLSGDGAAAVIDVVLAAVREFKFSEI